MSRSIVLSRRALLAGIITMPEGVTYLHLAGRTFGEFPHVASPDGCRDSLFVEVLGGPVAAGSPADLWCTREPGHEGQHVAHLQPGQPVAAWFDENRASEETEPGPEVTPAELCMVCAKTGPVNFECPHMDAHTPLDNGIHDANGEPYEQDNDTPTIAGL